MDSIVQTERLIVRSLKYDGRVHREWSGTVRHRDDTLIMLDAVFDAEVRHPLLGTIERGTQSTEYFWTNRFYSVFRFAEPSGALRNYYCNVNTPAIIECGVLSFTDLDIDLLVAPDMTYQVLDREEFEANSVAFNYPPELRASALAAIEELRTLIERRAMPFDF